MPEALIDKHSSTVFGQTSVWRFEQILAMAPVAEAHAVHEASHDHFELGALAFDPAIILLPVLHPRNRTVQLPAPKLPSSVCEKMC